ncbi:MAG: energy-coupling factor transporter ATPase [Actinomycetota bacterium]|nr:energy-coupling factor transporter ATPase [Actinomycetota bacterium]
MLIELINVGFTYLEGTPLAQRALRDVSLSIEKGEFVGIIGPTGSGKSTLIQLFNGLLTPAEGKVLIDGREIGKDGIPSHLVRQKIGLVFQFPENQLFEETVFDDIAFGPRNLGCSESEVERRVRKALELVELDFNLFKDRSPFSLSGGEMRRVAMAGVLAMEPEALILDEPTSGLDPRGRKEIMSRLEYLHHLEGLTIVLVTHNMDEVAHLVDRLIVLNEGSILLDDIPRKIFLEAVTLKRIGLDIPQVTSLVRALRDQGIDVPVDVFEVEEARDVIFKYFKERRR